MSKSKSAGKVYLVGAGPGDPGLLTLRGRALLEQADIVFYDYLVNPRLLSHCPQAVQKYVGKVGHGDRIAQNQIQEQLVEASQVHQTIVRLKGGDPFIFGRGGEEAEYLAAKGVLFEVVPGISSAIAATAYAGIPLTHRDFASSVSFVTGHGGDDTNAEAGIVWDALAQEKTIVFLMGVRAMKDNFCRLIAAGKSENCPAAIIQWGTYPQQRSLSGTLSDLPAKAEAAGFKAPAVIVVGEVVRLRESLNWFEQRPLFGRRILVTRSRLQVSQLSLGLEDLGAEVMELPSIELLPPNDWGLVDRALYRLSDYDYLIFSSVNGVEFFFARMEELAIDIRSLAGLKIAAVGSMTASLLAKRGLRDIHLPEVYTSDALAASLSKQAIAGKKILFPRATVAREAIVAVLTEAGAALDVLPVYRAKCPQYSPDDFDDLFEQGLPDLLSFASSATVENFCKLMQATPYWQDVQRIPAVVIGPITCHKAKTLGLNVIAEADPQTIPGMIATIQKCFEVPKILGSKGLQPRSGKQLT